MRPFRAPHKRGLALAMMASTAALVAPGVANAALQANAPFTTTSSPDVRSAKIVTATPNTAQVCFDQPIQPPPTAVPIGGTGGGFTGPTGIVPGISLRGYGLTSPASVVGGVPPIAAKVEVGDPNCLRLTFPVVSGANSYVSDQTLIEVQPSAVQDLAGRNNAPGSAMLDGSTITPLAGATVGPDLVQAVPDGTANTVTFFYNTGITPIPVGANGAFWQFYTSSGNTATGPITGDFVTGQGANWVTVHFPVGSAGGASVLDAVRLISQPLAVFRANPFNLFPSAWDVTDYQGGNGGTTERPNLLSATPVANLPGVYDLKYDKVVFASSTSVLPGCIAIPENPWNLNPTGAQLLGLGYIGRSLGRPNQDPKTIRVSFNTSGLGGPLGGLGGVDSIRDQKVVEIADLGDLIGLGCVTNMTGSASSSGGEVNVRTAHMQKGFTEGPDLSGFTVDQANGTGTYAFDQDVNPLSFQQAQNALLKTDSLFNIPVLPFPGSALGQLLNANLPTDKLVVQFDQDQLSDTTGGVIVGPGNTPALPAGLPFPLTDFTGAQVLTSTAGQAPAATGGGGGGGSTGTGSGQQQQQQSVTPPPAATAAPAAAAVQSTTSRPVTTTTAKKATKKAKKAAKKKKAKKAKKARAKKKSTKSRKSRRSTKKS